VIKSLLIVVCGLILSACSPCASKFQNGEIVEHILTKDVYLVLQSHKFINYQGYCLVEVREAIGEKRLILLSRDEIKKLGE